MPIGIVIFVFVLILVALGFLVRWEFRRMIRNREAQMFETLYNSRF